MLQGYCTSTLLGTSSMLWLVCLLAAYSPTSPSYSPTSPGEPLLHDSALLIFYSVRFSRGFFHFLTCAHVSNFSFSEVQLLSFSEGMICCILCTLSICFKQLPTMQKTSRVDNDDQIAQLKCFDFEGVTCIVWHICRSDSKPHTSNSLHNLADACSVVL